jgi:hypothetical protein
MSARLAFKNILGRQTNYHARAHPQSFGLWDSVDANGEPYSLSTPGIAQSRLVPRFVHERMLDIPQEQGKHEQHSDCGEFQ